tara:strand:- start:21670 stop:22482 length:813 start_codon:yes stop_codon:yes gene_type:complete
MKNTKYKITILSDLKDTEALELKNIVSFAKMINGEIDFFHVTKSTELVRKDSQLSAMRSINDTFKTTDNKLRALTTSFSENYNIDINYSFAFGNIKNEIKAYLEQSKPDIVVLGKKKNSPFKLIGDKVTELILKQHNGPILIADHENSLEPTTDLSVGLLNCGTSLNFDFASKLIGASKKPLKSFQIGRKTESSQNVKNKELKTVDFVFDQSDDTTITLEKYLTQYGINLLCVDRILKHEEKDKALYANFNDIIHSLNVTLLITGKTQLN